MFTFFEDLIIAVPTYYETKKHKHAMLHILISDEEIYVEGENGLFESKLVFIGQDVVHKVTTKTKNTLVIFVDPSSAIADVINKRYLKGEKIATGEYKEKLRVENENAEEVIDITKNILKSFGIYDETKKKLDERVEAIIEQMGDREYILKSLDKIAEESALSTSRLSHLFKEETNMRLKNYLLMHRLKFVYQEVSEGKSITRAAMDMGFSDSSHLATVASRLTGIPITTYFVKDS